MPEPAEIASPTKPIAFSMQDQLKMKLAKRQQVEEVVSDAPAPAKALNISAKASTYEYLTF